MRPHLIGLLVANVALSAIGQVLLPHQRTQQSGDCLSDQAKRNPSLVLVCERLPGAEVERLSSVWEARSSPPPGARFKKPDAIFKVSMSKRTTAEDALGLGFSFYPVHIAHPNTPENFRIYDVALVDTNIILTISGHPLMSFCNAMTASTNGSEMKPLQRVPVIPAREIKHAWFGVNDGSAAAYFVSTSGRTNTVTWKRDSGWHSQFADKKW